MTAHKFASVLAVSALVGILSACTSTGETGSPKTAAPPSSGASSATSEKLPPRPQEVKLDGVDACKLLTPAQMAQIQVSSTTANSSKVADVPDVPGCLYRNTARYGYDVRTLTTKGISHWFGGSGNIKSAVVDVDGFGAAEITLIGVKDVDCTIAVDVADGQQLLVRYAWRSESEPQTQLCTKAKTAASLALETLKTLK